MKKFVFVLTHLVLVLTLVCALTVSIGAETLGNCLVPSDSGSFVKSSLNYEDGELISKSEVTFENNMPVRIDRFELNEEGVLELYCYWLVVYSGNNTATSTEYVLPDETVKEFTVYTYTDDFLILTEEYYRRSEEGSDKLESSVEYTYDEKGNELTSVHKFFYSEGSDPTSVISCTNTYDANGNLLEEEFVRTGPGSSDTKTVYTYDEQGRELTEEYLIRKHEDGADYETYSDSVTTYDETGKGTNYLYYWDEDEGTRDDQPSRRIESNYTKIGSKYYETTRVRYDWDDDGEGEWTLNYEETKNYDKRGNVLTDIYKEAESEGVLEEVYTYLEEPEPEAQEKGFPVILIVVMILAVLIGAYVCGYFFLYKKGKLLTAAVFAKIYLPMDKIVAAVSKKQ